MACIIPRPDHPTNGLLPAFNPNSPPPPTHRPNLTLLHHHHLIHCCICYCVHMVIFPTVQAKVETKIFSPTLVKNFFLQFRNFITFLRIQKFIFLRKFENGRVRLNSSRGPRIMIPYPLCTLYHQLLGPITHNNNYLTYILRLFCIL